MASRMERYYKPVEGVKKRSIANKDLYKQIYDNVEYSNIEGIATIEKSNEVDIEKLKKMLQSREQNNVKSQGRYNLEETSATIVDDSLEEERSYDIQDVLTRVKKSQQKSKYHSIRDQNLNFEPKKNVEESAESLKKIDDNELSLGLLDDLRGNTTIQDTRAIKQLLEEARKEEEKPTTSKKDKIDSSFYTSTFNFKDDDFEDFIGGSKSNGLAKKVLMYTVIVFIAVAIILVVYNLIK